MPLGRKPSVPQDNIKAGDDESFTAVYAVVWVCAHDS